MWSKSWHYTADFNIIQNSFKVTFLTFSPIERVLSCSKATRDRRGISAHAGGRATLCIGRWQRASAKAR